MGARPEQGEIDEVHPQDVYGLDHGCDLHRSGGCAGDAAVARRRRRAKSRSSPGPGYIERGETDPNYDWVTKFEADSGCKVSVKTANTSDEMVALMNEGGFDLVTASGDASLRLDRRQARAADQHGADPVLVDHRRAAARTPPGTRSMAPTTARPMSGAPTC